MKLLFDENLSPKLPRLLAMIFPDSVHARECHLLGQTDEDVWEYARLNGYTIVSRVRVTSLNLTIGSAYHAATSKRRRTYVKFKDVTPGIPLCRLPPSSRLRGFV